MRCHAVLCCAVLCCAVQVRRGGARFELPESIRTLARYARSIDLASSRSASHPITSSSRHGTTTASAVVSSSALAATLRVREGPCECPAQVGATMIAEHESDVGVCLGLGGVPVSLMSATRDWGWTGL
ncbi:hypothetical protein F4780DRAFT_357413 [Xylariomycetidae sp. FL0641]|nr:hypothetical protein F4780DRAFT_357413 [Xylariomycetidae sp. FL0641]